MLKPPCIVLNSSMSLTKLKAKTTLPSVKDNTAGNYCSAVFLNYTFSQFFKIALYSRSPNSVGPGGRPLKVPVTFLAQKAVLCLPFLHSRSTSQ